VTLRARAGLTLVGLAAGIWLLPRVAPLARARERAFLVDPVHCETAAAPDWLEGPIEERLRASLAALAPVPLEDDERLNALVQELARSSGWIRSIDRVEKRYPNRLEVEATLRQPVALVRSELGMLLVDGEAVAVALASESGSYLAGRELPLLNGLSPVRDVAFGQRVRHPALESLLEGLQVALDLEPHRESLAARGLSVALIDLAPQRRAGGRALTEIELYTASGLAIEWGRSTRHRLGVLEPAVDAKVRGLLRIAAKHPDLAGVRRIRVQFEKPTVVLEESEPVAGAPPGFAPGG
jgi:hypothetical protein